MTNAMRDGMGNSLSPFPFPLSPSLVQSSTKPKSVTREAIGFGR